MVVYPGTLTKSPRAWISTQASGPPRSLTVQVRGSRGFRRGKSLHRRPAAAFLIWPPAGRLTITCRHCQVVDPNGCSASKGGDGVAPDCFVREGMPVSSPRPAGGTRTPGDLRPTGRDALT